MSRDSWSVIVRTTTGVCGWPERYFGGTVFISIREFLNIVITAIVNYTALAHGDDLRSAAKQVKDAWEGAFACSDGLCEDIDVDGSEACATDEFKVIVRAHLQLVSAGQSRTFRRINWTSY